MILFKFILHSYCRKGCCCNVTKNRCDDIRFVINKPRWLTLMTRNSKMKYFKFFPLKVFFLNKIIICTNFDLVEMVINGGRMIFFHNVTIFENYSASGDNLRYGWFLTCEENYLHINFKF